MVSWLNAGGCVCGALPVGRCYDAKFREHLDSSVVALVRS
ncbi:hypothetical protein COLINT_03256 [Collinsella intestinalis DSM 13280]|uniref:Uncharacterized protein n=1 Tax=Collinsella intestinalis DSM 13280 TaxID=521003 RepID=C4FB06_9ACTN|nr:hypothetical protein COLINT_03256 [Collinsella intestinalis DSM 13280]